jgi:hypothetical protein
MVFVKPGISLGYYSPNQPGRIKRVYDTQCLPFDRFYEKEDQTPEGRQIIQAWRDTTNLFQLKREIERLKELLFALPYAGDGTLEDIY